MQELRIAVLTGEQLPLQLLADGAGRWKTVDGVPLLLLDGCVDVDLSATPFTNTLPIRRLDWRSGT